MKIKLLAASVLLAASSSVMASDTAVVPFNATGSIGAACVVSADISNGLNLELVTLGKSASNQQPLRVITNIGAPTVEVEFKSTTLETVHNDQPAPLDNFTLVNGDAPLASTQELEANENGILAMDLYVQTSLAETAYNVDPNAMVTGEITIKCI